MRQANNPFNHFVVQKPTAKHEIVRQASQVGETELASQLCSVQPACDADQATSWCYWHLHHKLVEQKKALILIEVTAINFLYSMSGWWYYPTPSEGWGHGRTLQRPNIWATPQGLDRRSRIERVYPKIDL